jgi:zinc protease
MRIFLFLSLFCIAACFPLQAKERVLDIQEIESPGGIKAWLVEDTSLPVITMRFSFKGSGALQNSEEQQGLALMLSNTMDEGAGDLDSQAFQKILNDNSISLSFSSDRDNFGGYLSTLSRHKSTAFDLLTKALKEPRFDSEPLERMRAANISRVLSSKGKPGWINSRLFNDLAYEGHPYAFNSGGTITSLKQITASDLRDYKNNWLSRDKLIVSATGDISGEELGLALDRIFGHLPNKSTESNIKPTTIQNTGNIYVYEKEIPQTIISMAMSGIDERDPDYYPLLVMNSIFGASGFGSRLMKEIREEKGLTYGIHSTLISYDLVNGLEISTSTKNESAAEMIELIKAEMEKMKVDPVSDAELSEAKSYITGSLPLSLTSTNNISAVLQDLQLDGYKSDYLDTFSSKINAVSKADIIRVANRVLNPDEMIVIMVGQPENLENFTLLDTVPNVE